MFPLTLRGIGKTVAASAAKAIAGEIKPEHRPAAVRADEERPLATEGARPPAERDRGRDAWAVALPYPKPVAQAELMPVADDQEIGDWPVIDPVPLGLPAFEDAAAMEMGHVEGAMLLDRVEHGAVPAARARPAHHPAAIFVEIICQTSACWPPRVASGLDLAWR